MKAMIDAPLTDLERRALLLCKATESFRFRGPALTPEVVRAYYEPKPDRKVFVSLANRGLIRFSNGWRITEDGKRSLERSGKSDR